MFQDRAVLFGGLDLVGDRGDDHVADLVEQQEGVVVLEVELFGPDDAQRPCLDKFDCDEQAARQAVQHATDKIVDLQRTRRLFRRHAFLGQREHRATGDQEQAAQFCEAADDVVREARRDIALGHKLA